jgi:inositol-1,3,4-trisphosphate 5/6-kinase/inositol-tetrakisphosphate 1-kinase
MRSYGIAFPLMVKGEAAAGSTFAHTLTVAFNEAGLQNCLEYYVEGMSVQEFVNHNATVYKCYAIGDDLSYYHRKSAANLAVGEHDIVRFLSSEPWPESLKSSEEPVVVELSKET